MNESSDIGNKKLTLDHTKLRISDKLKYISTDYQSAKSSATGKTVTTIEVRKSKRKTDSNVDEGIVSNVNINRDDLGSLTLKEQMSRISALQNANINNKDVDIDINNDQNVSEKIVVTEEIHENAVPADSDPFTGTEQETVHAKKFKKHEKDFEEKKGSAKKVIVNDVYDKHAKLIIEEALQDQEKPVRRSSYHKKHRNNKKVVRAKISRKVLVPDKITVQELSNRMSERGKDVLHVLSEMGEVLTLTGVLDASLACDIVLHFNHTFKRVSSSQVEDLLYQEENRAELFLRPPVVTVMGHVDHGKTSLLDAIRKTNIVQGEFGGITQHIGAYQVTVDNKKITFIDTPGHEAFTSMRSRGANITDIVVLVVAADDGIMPQTVEAINHAKAAGVSIIVAVNKIDKPGADVRKITNDLLQYGIVPEDLGGDVIIVPVSAREGTNLDKLKDAILLIAELLELEAAVDCRATGIVIESKIDKNRGILTTLIVQKGTLKIGDIIVVGNNSYGKIRNMFNDASVQQKEALPFTPVEILGLNNVPQSGDNFIVVDSEKQARDLIDHRIHLLKEKLEINHTLDEYSLFNQNKVAELNVILKCDVMGSVEAIYDSISKLTHEELKLNILHRAVGNITDSDIMLAESSNATILAFNVKADAKIRDLAKQKGINIKSYSIIYEIIDDIRATLNGMLKPLVQEVRIGALSIKQVFSTNKSGSVLGCYVTSGMVKRGSLVKLMRNNGMLYEGKLKALRRFKDDVKEVKSGFECGIFLDYNDDIQPESDIIEVLELVEEARSIK